MEPSQLQQFLFNLGLGIATLTVCYVCYRNIRKQLNRPVEPYLGPMGTYIWLTKDEFGGKIMVTINAHNENEARVMAKARMSEGCLAYLYVTALQDILNRPPDHWIWCKATVRVIPITDAWK